MESIKNFYSTHKKKILTGVAIVVIGFLSLSDNDMAVAARNYVSDLSGVHVTVPMTVITPAN